MKLSEGLDLLKQKYNYVSTSSQEYLEIEEKYVFDDIKEFENVKTILKNMLNNSLINYIAKPTRLFDTKYYDTESLHFKRNNLSLRKRITKDGDIQWGVKGLPRKQNDLLIRHEEEHIINDPGLDKLLIAPIYVKSKFKDYFTSSISKKVIKNISDNETLGVPFTTIVERESFEFEVLGLPIDVVFDKVYFITHSSYNKDTGQIHSNKSPTIYELELEFIGEEPHNFKEIRSAFDKFLSTLTNEDKNIILKRSDTTKADRGYEFLNAINNT